MISFHHGQTKIVVETGQLWAEARAGSYRDTAAESLWSIIGQVDSGVPWREAVGARYAQSYPWLYQCVTSPARALFFRQYPPPPGSHVLDIGSGWGQMALPIARENAAHVTALEPTPERLAFIRAAAVQENLTGRMHFVQASFLAVDFDPVFDLVSCIGVLEWVPKFQAGNAWQVQLEFVRRMRSALRPGGKCYVGIENRMGLKYLMGARDDHTSLRNISVFDSRLATSKHHAATGQELRAFTYSHAEYLDLFHEAGFTAIETFAAFPDYKIPEIILPFADSERINQFLRSGPIPSEHDGIDGHILQQQEDFVSHYRSLAHMGLAHYFSPSFFFSLQ